MLPRNENHKTVDESVQKVGYDDVLVAWSDSTKPVAMFELHVLLANFSSQISSCVPFGVQLEIEDTWCNSPTLWLRNQRRELRGAQQTAVGTFEPCNYSIVW